MSNDFLPIEDHTVLAVLQRQEEAAALGLSPVCREREIRRVSLRPGINPVSLPKQGRKEKVWPRIIARCYGSVIERFEDNRLVWEARPRRVINGSPVAYHPFNQNAIGRIDEQKARGYPALVFNDKGELARQGSEDPVPGHLVSRTAYQHPGFDRTDQRRYLDAGVVPYISVPLELVLHYRDDWPLLLGSTAIIRDRTRGGYKFQAVVGDIDLHGPGGFSKYLWERMEFTKDVESTYITFEFQVFAGVAFEGFKLQKWSHE